MKELFNCKIVKSLSESIHDYKRIFRFMHLNAIVHHRMIAAGKMVAFASKRIIYCYRAFLTVEILLLLRCVLYFRIYFLILSRRNATVSSYGKQTHREDRKQCDLFGARFRVWNVLSIESQNNANDKHIPRSFRNSTK